MKAKVFCLIALWALSGCMHAGGYIKSADQSTGMAEIVINPRLFAPTAHHNFELAKLTAEFCKGPYKVLGGKSTIENPTRIKCDGPIPSE